MPLHDRRTSGILALLLAIVVVGAWLRLRNLGADSFWSDEAVSWLQSSGSLADLIARTAQDNYPPLHNLLLFAFMNVGGSDTEWLLRLPSALLGIANIAAIYWLGALIGGRTVGILAAALLATSSFHIYYSQEARMYSLLAFTATLYAASAFFFIRSPTASRAALLAVCGLALVYSHAFGTLNWIAISIGVSTAIFFTSGFPRHGFVTWIAANAAIGLGLLPWALILLHRAQAISGDFWLPSPSAGYVIAQLYRLSGVGLAGAAMLVSAVIGLRSRARSTGVLLAWFLGPIAVALIASWLSTPIFHRRYLIGGLPALSVLAAVGMAHLACRPERSAKLVAALLLVVAASGKLTDDTRPRDDWRTASAYLDGRVRGSDCILVYPRWQAAGLQFYLRRPICTVLPRSVAALDLQEAPATRVFAVVVRVSSELPEVTLLRTKMKAFGREGDTLSTSTFSIVEYVRRP